MVESTLPSFRFAFPVNCVNRTFAKTPPVFIRHGGHDGEHCRLFVGRFVTAVRILQDTQIEDRLQIVQGGARVLACDLKKTS